MAVNIKQIVPSNSAKYLSNNKNNISIYCESCKYYHPVTNNHSLVLKNKVLHQKIVKNKNKFQYWILWVITTINKEPTNQRKTLNHLDTPVSCDNWRFLASKTCFPSNRFLWKEKAKVKKELGKLNSKNLDGKNHKNNISHRLIMDNGGRILRHSNDYKLKSRRPLNL